ncbi:hypothetical protein PINS_up019704, partial [Pythium insidiosum]
MAATTTCTRSRLLTEEIKSDEVETRIKAMRRLKTVAQALGRRAHAQRTRAFPARGNGGRRRGARALAEELGAFVELVGGPSTPLFLSSHSRRRLVYFSRCPRARCFAAVYPKITDSGRRKELRDLFQILTNDDTPMVRRAAASNVGKFAATLEKEHITTLVIPLFKALTADDQDSVRLLAIENSAMIAKLLTPEENTQHVLPIVRSSVEDRSWRVRFSIA